MPQKPKKERFRVKAIPIFPLYIALAVMAVLYLVFEGDPLLSVMLGAVLLLILLAIVIIEITNQLSEEGWWKGALQIAISIGIVVLVWFGMKYLLHTDYPLDVVPSCSMLPYLQRGDMLLLQGVGITGYKAPVISVNASAWASSFANSNESYQCVAYNDSGGRLSVSQTLWPNYHIGLLTNAGGHSTIVPQSAQGNDVLKYHCGTTSVRFSNGTSSTIVYTSSITLGGENVTGDKNNDVVVYRTSPGDAFYSAGDSYVVHRIYAIADVGGNYYFLTKGDNNPGLDVQYGNMPVPAANVEGKMVASVPYLGYVKLILSSDFSKPAGCDYTISNP